MLKENVRAGYYVDAGSDHGGRVNQGANGRGAFHGVGQPDVQRKLGGFAARTHEEEQTGNREGTEDAPAFARPGRIRGGGEELRKIEGFESAEEQEHAKHEAEDA